METGGRTPNASADRKMTFLAAGAEEMGRTMFWMWSMGVGHTGVLGDALVCEVDVALSIQSNVLQQSVALDGVVDIGLRSLSRLMTFA